MDFSSFNINALNISTLELISKIDKNEIPRRIDEAINLLKTESVAELSKKVNFIGRDQIINKMYEMDKATLQRLQISTIQIRSKLNAADFQKLSQLFGARGNEVVIRLKFLLS